MMLVPAMLLLAQLEDGGVGSLVKALTDEATNFTRCASKVYTEETLTHRVPKGPPGKWKEFKVISNYSFASPRERSAAVREIRLIESVNGRGVKRDDSLDTIAMSVASGSDQDRLKMMAQLEKHGVHGVATDLGQLLLLFSEATIGNYEFGSQGSRTGEDGTRYLSFTFRQIDGRESMTVFREGAVAAKPKLSGELWVRLFDTRLFRVTLNSVVPGGGQFSDSMQEMTVDYGWQEAQGCLLPVAALHREHRDGEVQVENKYSYKPYKAFGGK